MASDVSIANQALAASGSRTQISSLDDNTKQAKTVKLFYASTRDSLLREAQWGFADKFVALGLLTSLPGAPGSTETGGSVWSPNFPAPGWLYQYSYPEDCLKANWIIPQGQWGAFLAQAQTDGPWRAFKAFAVPFALSSSGGIAVINTNAQQAILSYTMRVENAALFPPDFEEALVGRLAFKIVIPLSGDKVLATGADGKADQLVEQAKASDANEGLTVIDNIPDWLQARDWPTVASWPWVS